MRMGIVVVVVGSRLLVNSDFAHLGWDLLVPKFVDTLTHTAFSLFLPMSSLSLLLSLSWGEIYCVLYGTLLVFGGFGPVLLAARGKTSKGPGGRASDLTASSERMGVRARSRQRDKEIHLFQIIMESNIKKNLCTMYEKCVFFELRGKCKICINNNSTLYGF